MSAFVRLQLRRDRLQLIIWILVIVALAAGSVSSVVKTYGGATERAQVLSIALAQPAVVALRGAPNGGSLGSLLWFELFTYLAVIVALMNTFFATRHGRADEEAGRRELTAATPTSRRAPLAATLLIGFVVDVVIGVGTAGGFATAKLPVAGALLAGAAFTATGIAFLGLAVLVGELAPTGRAANGTSAAIVVLAYLLRAAGDAGGTAHIRSLTLDPTWLSWVSPVGWGEQTYAFTANRAWVLALPFVLFVVTAAAALILRARRDIGWSLLPERRGPSRASGALRGPISLAFRLSRWSLIAWAVGGALFGSLAAALGGAVSHLVSGDASVTKILQALGNGRGDLLDLFVAAIMTLTGMMAAAAGIQATLRLRDEEQAGRAETALAAPVHRASWVGASVLVGAASAVAVLGAAGVVAAIGLAASGDGAHAWTALGQSAANLPAAVVFVGIAAVLCTALPRVAVGATWALFGVGAVLGLFGALLGVDETIRNISPFSDVPAVPIAHWTGIVVTALVAVVLPIAALAAFRRRNVPA